MSRAVKRFNFPDPIPPLHVNCQQRSDEPAHVLSEDCWCTPKIVRSKESGVVVNHSGLMLPSTAAGIAAEHRFDGLLAPAAPVAGWADRRLA